MQDIEDRTILGLPSQPADGQIPYGDEASQVADVWQSRLESTSGLVILIHGGFWRPDYDRGHLGPMANALADAGYRVASIEYRREPGRPDVMTQDVRIACERIPQMLGWHGTTTLIGHSAGGHLALWYGAAGATAPTGILALAPVASLLEAESRELDRDAVRAFLGTSAAARPDLDPCELNTKRVSTTLIHGTADAIVPIALATKYQQRHPDTRVVPLENTGHFALIDPRSRAWPTVLAELRTLATQSYVQR